MRKPRQGPAKPTAKKAGSGSDLLPYPLKRELEEITRNTGQEIDMNQGIAALEKICDDANYPREAWRDRWSQ